MLSPYRKDHLSLQDQLALLKSRGLEVADDNVALDCLHRYSYFRLSAYWYPFRVIVPKLDNNENPSLDKHGKPEYKAGDQFHTGSTFEDACELYSFDKKLKLLLLDAIAGIEIAVRSDISLTIGCLDKFAHLNSTFFHRSFITNQYSPGEAGYDKWLSLYHKSVDNAKDEFVIHHRKKYGSQSPLPIWMATELWDFGLLSHFYLGIDTPHKITIAARFGILDWNVMLSWLRSLNYVRNVIAHHGRLWNKVLVTSPVPPSKGLISDFDALLSRPDLNARIYFICCILCHFSRVIDSQSTWPQQLKNLINEFPPMPHVSIQNMGFPTDWQSHNFWN